MFQHFEFREKTCWWLVDSNFECNPSSITLWVKAIIEEYGKRNLPIAPNIAAWAIRSDDAIGRLVIPLDIQLASMRDRYPSLYLQYRNEYEACVLRHIEQQQFGKKRKR